MRPFHFDKEKYLLIARSEGIPTALTRLHEDLAQWEYLAFEGDQGYQPQMWDALHDVRKFSRELWQMALE